MSTSEGPSSSSNEQAFYLEQPQILTEVLDNSALDVRTVMIPDPADWIPMLAVQHRMAQRDIQHLYQLSGEELERSEPLNREIERNYDAIYDATHYLFETYKANREIAHEWLCTRLIFFASAAQAFSQDVWAEISPNNNDDSQDIIIQTMITTRRNDAIAFLQTADSERQRKQATYLRKLKDWTVGK
jgi:hypothetical protein